MPVESFPVAACFLTKRVQLSVLLCHQTMSNFLQSLQEVTILAVTENKGQQKSIQNLNCPYTISLRLIFTVDVKAGSVR